MTGRNRYCIDKNYASVLIVWDKMFGTFEPEQEKVVYGLTTPIQSFDPLTLQFGHYRDLVNRCLTMKGWRSKLSALVKGPGWEPGKPRLGLIEDIPDINAHNCAPPYQPHVSPVRELYCALHFFIVLCLHVALAESATRLTQSVILVNFAFIFLSLTAFGALMEGKPFADSLEISRCFVFLVLEQVLLGSAPRSILSHGCRLAFFASLLFWSIRYLSRIQVFSEKLGQIKRGNQRRDSRRRCLCNDMMT